MALQAIRYSRDTNALALLDQRQLPSQTVYVPVASAEAAHACIRDMVVRGAPAIAITAALAVAVELSATAPGLHTGEAAAAFVASRLDFLVTSRPTAVNLAEIAGRIKRVAAAAAPDGPAAVVACVIDAAEGELKSDLETNKRLGQNGARALAEHAPRVRVLTHCNTGSLATAGYGTALGVVRALAANEALGGVFATETRPYNQGARLTAFELVHDGLEPATLIADSAAAALMAAGHIDAVVVGADRVAANGDTANKIGTYALAVAAHYHHIPFYVAAPVTSLDPSTPDGASIQIEQRSPDELTHFRGERVAAAGIGVWNPAFDVTPAALIAGIITEETVLRRDSLTHTFPVAALVAAARTRRERASAVAAIVPQLDTTARSSTSSFYRLDAEKVIDYVASKTKLAERLGGKPSAWTASEVGDGNINYIYRLQGPGGALILKQALPFIRMIGVSWPLSQDRIKFEAAALMEERRCCPSHVPEVYLWDEGMAVIAMQYIEPPHEILRGALVAGRCFPELANHMAEFLASTLFNTSALALRGSAFRRAIASYANVNMCELTEQVVFTDPFYASPFNSHTSPQLDDDAAALRADSAAKSAATALKRTFMESTQALLHGDLHTGSVMVKDTSTFVFDCEFSFYGPMGFDIGAFLGNLLLAFFAAEGHESSPGERAAQRSWLLSCVREIWVQFVGRFKALWSEAVKQGTAGEACPPALFGTDAFAAAGSLATVQDAFLAGVLRDALGFAGCKMARRIVGVAHVADFTSIVNVDVRAKCERRALRFGRRLLVHASTFSSIDAVIVAAEETRTSL